MTRMLASLTFLAHVLLAKSDGMCQGTAECGSEEDTSTALLQLHQAAPASRGPLQHDDPPQVDCRSQPRNGTCWAQQTACELMGMMAQWQHSDNAGIARVKEQLREQCYSRAAGKAAATAEVGTGERECFGTKYFSCVTDVEEYYREHPGSEYGMKAAEPGVKMGLDLMRRILQEEGALPSPVVLAFVGAVFANFFPSTGGPARNPCTGARDWAQCIWEEVGPLVASFVGVDGDFADLWKEHLRSFQVRLWEINTTANGECPDKNPNGTVRSMPHSVREWMFSQLSLLNEDMWDGAPLFAGHQSTAAGAYLSMFGSLHVSVMASLLAAPELRTPHGRFASQSLILCYARRALARALEARNRRLLLVSRKDMGARCLMCPVPAQENFSAPAMIHKCCGEEVLYRDQARGCSWSEVCEPQPTICGAGHECHKAQPCAASKAEKAYECHKAHVQRQSDAMWEQWLAPIPGWLEMVAMMQEADLGVRTASDFEKGNLGTCPPDV